MLTPDEVTIETPEQINLGLEPAGLGSRFYAAVVDFLFWLLAIFAIGVVGVIIAGLAGFNVEGGSMFQSGVLGVLVILVYASQLGYDVFFEMVYNGRTPGKRAAGLRVVRDGGGPIDLRSSCVRNLLRPADLLPMFYLVGAALILLTARRQRLGDLAAKTLVIRERAVSPPGELDEVLAPFVSDQFAFTREQLEACGPADRQVLRSFFLRMKQMDEMKARDLACRLAETMAEKIGPNPAWPRLEEGLAEGFLATLYRDLDHMKKQGRR